VQGTATGKGGRYLAVLAAGHVATAGVLFALLAQVGWLVHLYAPPFFQAGAITLAAIAGIAFDVTAVRRGNFSLGPHRQTPKVLAHDPHRWWIPPLLWGIDTGLVVTTYRVSFCSWVLLVMTLTGFAPGWSGLAYGLGFTLPLWVTVRLLPGCEEGGCDAGRPRWMPHWRAQAVGIVSMLALAADLLWWSHA
jgi:hypothetical protein